MIDLYIVHINIKNYNIYINRNNRIKEVIVYPRINLLTCIPIYISIKTDPGINLYINNSISRNKLTYIVYPGIKEDPGISLLI